MMFPDVCISLCLFLLYSVNQTSHGNTSTMRIWGELDTEKTGFISLKEIDPKVRRVTNVECLKASSLQKTDRSRPGWVLRGGFGWLFYPAVVKPGPSGAGGFQAWGWGGCSVLRMFRTSQVFWILGREAMESQRLFVGTLWRNSSHGHLRFCIEIAGQSALINMETCSMPGTMVLYSTFRAWKPENLHQSDDFHA